MLATSLGVSALKLEALLPSALSNSASQSPTVLTHIFIILMSYYVADNGHAWEEGLTGCGTL